MNISVIILAAGQGSRMQSNKPKVLHEVGGKPLVGHLIDKAGQLGAKQISVVVGHGSEQLQAAFDQRANLTWAKQEQQLGTAHAVQQALPTLEDTDVCLILVGDAPLVSIETLDNLARASQGEQLALLTVEAANPFGYGRIIKNDQGDVLAIVEEKDATQEQQKITEVNTGIMAVPGRHLAAWLDKVDNNNAQQEYYLTDLIAISVAQGSAVVTQHANSEMEVAGVNNRIQLAALERAYQTQQTQALMLAGATLLDPSRVDIRGEVSVGKDVTIDVNVQLIGDVIIGNNVTIDANCRIENCQIGDGTHIKAHCVFENAVIGQQCDIGPFARLRPKTHLADRAKVGNFVETKNTLVGVGSKINHLAYVGDATLGSDVNIGAGVITCNYDGANKHQTTIGDNAFVGSDVNLVAPVTIGEGATIGAGSTITKDAPDHQLTLTRAKQRSIEGWQRPEKNNTNKKA